MTDASQVPDDNETQSGTSRQQKRTQTMRYWWDNQTKEKQESIIEPHYKEDVESKGLDAQREWVKRMDGGI